MMESTLDGVHIWLFPSGMRSICSPFVSSLEASLDALIGDASSNTQASLDSPLSAKDDKEKKFNFFQIHDLDSQRGKDCFSF